MPSPATRIAFLTFLVVLGLTARELITSPRTEIPTPAPSLSLAQEIQREVVSGGTATTASEGIDTSDAVDSYGNEVTRAVATYQFDATGSLYELHSPRTEVPRLPAPKS
jgi:hypothetical protein